MASILTATNRVVTRLAVMVKTPVYLDEPAPGPEVEQYVIMQPDGGTPRSGGMDERREITDWMFRPMAVGRTKSACLDALAQLRSALEGFDLFPEDRSASRIWEEETNPPMLSDKSVAGDFRYSITPTYRLTFDR